jgi:hypothetical protein
MNCRAVKLWLLQAETLKATAWPSDITEHVVTCGSCSKVARKIRKLENKWRDELPVVVETQSAKAAFLKQLRQRQKPLEPISVEEIDILPMPAPAALPTKKKKRARPRSWQPLPWVAVAAVVLVSIGIFSYFTLAPGESRAASVDVLDRLIDLNLQISNANAKERQRLLEEHQALLRQDLTKAKLTDEEEQFAHELLENCTYLAENDDPIEEANLITDLADKIKSREEVAIKTGNARVKDQCSFQHQKVMQMGYHQIIERISQFKTPEGAKRPGYESFMKYDPMKQQQLHKMIEVGHGANRFQTELRKTLDSMRKKSPANHRGPGFGGPGFGGPGFGGPGFGGPGFNGLGKGGFGGGFKK